MIRPLPPSALRSVRRYERLSGFVALLLVAVPLAVPAVVFGTEELWPLGWRIAAGVLPFLAGPACLAFRAWRFGRVCPCPECGCRLRAERRTGVATVLLSCPRCGVTWDSGQEYDSRHPSETGG